MTIINYNHAEVTESAPRWREVFVSDTLPHHVRVHHTFSRILKLIYENLQKNHKILFVYFYLAHVIEQPIFRIPNLEYLQRNFCFDFLMILRTQFEASLRFKRIRKGWVIFNI